MLKKELEESVREDLKKEMRDKVEETLRVEITDDLRKTLKKEVASALRAEIKEKIAKEVDKEITKAKTFQTTATDEPVQEEKIAVTPGFTPLKTTFNYGRTFQQ